MLKIYGAKTSSNVQKVLWCCGELGLAFERDENTGGPSRNDRTPAYMALNPNGLIPTIDDDGFILWESNVIVRYLSAKHGMGSLCPADPRKRADCERWMDWQQTAIAAPMGVAFRALLRKPAEATLDDQVQKAVQRAGDAWKILDAHLAARPFVGGAALTIGDIALGNAIHRWFRLPIERPELPYLKAWYGRFCERPAYRQHIAGT
ncbi:MAG: glutathione S-transferase family protein [Casimicrobiaceae bacterium]